MSPDLSRKIKQTDKEDARPRTQWLPNTATPCPREVNKTLSRSPIMAISKFSNYILVQTTTDMVCLVLFLTSQPALTVRAETVRTPSVFGQCVVRFFFPNYYYYFGISGDWKASRGNSCTYTELRDELVISKIPSSKLLQLHLLRSELCNFSLNSDRLWSFPLLAKCQSESGRRQNCVTSLRTIQRRCSNITI